MEKLSCEDSKSHYAKAYLTMYEKFGELCDSFANSKINVADDESALFKNFLAFGKQSLDLMEDMDKMMSKIDKDKAAEIKESQKKGSAASLESMISKLK